MMYTRNCILSFGLLLACTLSYAQTKIPNFGKIDKADLEMKECASDKSAPAMVLYNEGTVVFNWDHSRNDFEMEKTVRTRIKVFTTKGLSYADIKLMYSSKNKYEQISGISAHTYNLDDGGNIVTTKMSKDLVITKKENENTSSTSFSVPGVKPGSVFEFRYTIIKKSFSRIDPWLFQDRIPTRASVFEIEMPEFFRFIPRLNINGSSQLEKTSEDGQRSLVFPRDVIRMGVTRYRYVLTDVQALKMESYMSGFKDYLQRINLQLSDIIIPGELTTSFRTSWKKLAEELYEDDYFGGQIRKRVSIDELDKQLEKYTTDKDKIECIHAYMRDHFEWDGNEDFMCLNVKKIADQRSGSTGDINLLLLNLLRSNNIESYPLLVSTRENGRILGEYPFLDQFNSLNVLVKEGGKYFVLNGADKYNPTNLIPYDVMYTEAFLVDKEQASIITLWDETMKDKNMVSYMATIGNDGSISGDVFISSSGYAKNPKVKALKKGNELYIKEDLKDDQSGITIENFSAKNTNIDTLNLEQRFRFKTKLQGSGDYLFFNPNIFTNLNENPFVAEKRVSNIDFGYNRQVILNAQISIPEGYQLEELPKAPGLMMADSSINFRRKFMQQENIVIVRMIMEINRPVFGAEEYEDFREFYKQLYLMLNEQIVLKKKK